MRTYFDSIDAIHRFTMELNYLQDSIKCKHCFKSNQFVSHGFVYKKQSNGEKVTVGKRVYCSNRHGKLGCGRTTRLYLASHIPTLQYTTSHLFTFIYALLSMASIQRAYREATKCDEPRNAYRWLHRLWKNLIDYRCFIQTYSKCLKDKYESRIRRLQILLPTFQALFLKLGQTPCAQFQKLTQRSFI